jgi:PAS domain S-box-containing protein
LSPATCTSSTSWIASVASRIRKKEPYVRGLSEPQELVNSEKPEWLRQMEPILETLNDGVIVADECGEILFVNSVFEEMTRMLRSEIIRRDAHSMNLGAEDDARLQAFRKETHKARRSRKAFLLPAKDGKRLSVVVRVRVMRQPGGEPFTVVTLTYTSEQKYTEGNLRAASAWPGEHPVEIEQDLTLGARVQQSLAPKPLLWGRLRVDTFYKPSHTIGGDFGVVRPMNDEYLDLLIGDVSGHGISSALIANRIYAETITQLSHRAPLVDVLGCLNALVIENIGSLGFFVTLAAARIDHSGRSMEFAGAGHPPAMIVQPGAEPRLLPSRSTILGALPDAVDADATLYTGLEPGDRIVLYTDGITDVFDSRGEMLKVDGVQSFVRETASLPFGEMKQGILNRVAAWSNGPSVDDVSLVLVEVR